MPAQTPADKEVFALDIGTRTIVGLILAQTPKGLHIRAAEVFEHTSRAMYDGQVHNVAAVAEGVRKVKTALERRLKHPLTRAAVAAAGRALKTARGEAQREKSASQEVTPADVRALELEALRAAQESLARAEGQAAAAGYFCVGYSVTQYILEGAPISELTGQFGREIGLSLIATFLPRVVVDSLFAVLRRAGLEAASLTLEPIAAAEVSIPPGMRQLNLALVDIGAGTSDIALVRRGNIYAYAMVPVAGDEITDALCQRFLLDFTAGEAVKRQLSTADTVTFTDILGQKQEPAAGTVVRELAPAIDNLAGQIAAEILSLNGRAPDAVLLVGGGSLTPTLPAALARALELPENRVGLRGRETIAAVSGQAKKLSGPQAVTPIGIAVTALKGSPLHFLKASVNGQPVYLWNLAGQTVAQALLAAGTTWNRLFGRPGLALTVEVNGELTVIPGGQGEPATIRVDGEPADLDTPLTEGARVEFAPGADGRNAQATAGDLAGAARFYRLNGTDTPFPPRLTVNGLPADPATPVPDRARVGILWQRPARELLLLAGVPAEQLVEEDFPFLLGGRRCTLPFSPCRLSINGRAAGLKDLVRPGDALDYTLAEAAPSVGMALAGRIAPVPPVTVSVNGQRVNLPGSGTTILVNGRPARLQDPLPRGAAISLVPGRSTAILSDLFALVDVKKNAQPGARLVMTVNGEPADFTTPLKDGDKVELSWA
ncbi:MAG: hypothetical protein PWR31_453 [Bacillota bacterium]|nr:hypothetical protein [Bacillota bacterium]